MVRDAAQAVRSIGYGVELCPRVATSCAACERCRGLAVERSVSRVVSRDSPSRLSGRPGEGQVTGRGEDEAEALPPPFLDPCQDSPDDEESNDREAQEHDDPLVPSKPPRG